ncbi:MAG: peptidase U62 [Elusimicrobia bacterium]|nr:peptidase U62 [Elusimicrobiota bacterium]
MNRRSLALAALILPILVFISAVGAAPKPKPASAPAAAPSPATTPAPAPAPAPAAAPAAPSAEEVAAASKDVLLQALRKELARSFGKLKDAEKPPLYFLAYEAADEHNVYMSAMLGAIRYENDGHDRQLTIDARIGDPALDSTHQIKGMEGWRRDDDFDSVRLPNEDDENSLRAAAWLHTDRILKAAREQFTKVLTNKAVTAEEEDKSDDFSPYPASRRYATIPPPKLDRDSWRRRLKNLSGFFKKYPFIIDSGVSFHAESVNRYILDSEGAEVVTGNPYVRLSYYLMARTTDGMDLTRHQSYDAASPEGIAKDPVILRDMERSAKELDALTKAPLVEPYTGPAIFRARASAVYFHEIMGHRVEGHRQKLEKEGQTFTKKLGQSVTAGFISVYDDATLPDFNGTFLRGHYSFDDEGVPSQKVTIVQDGILKGFLMTRSPIKNFPQSNGHARREPGHRIVARMGNTIVKASRAMPYAKLRQTLIEEVKRQKKPFGLVFDDISGGFTMTGRGLTQSFKVIPLLVYRVYPDGRPDEVVRGVDIVGTPLASFTKITAAADDDDVFNGTCGAESGSVPVSAVSPSLLLSEVEVEKKLTFSEKPPILPPPHHDKGGRP